MSDVGRLHVITDVVFQTRYSHGELAQLALAGGADTIQWREKRPLTTRELMADAAAVTEACDQAGAVAIIDDRADIAAAVGARGLHLGAHGVAVLSGVSCAADPAAAAAAYAAAIASYLVLRGAGR